jgi:hypothetical protein
VATAGLGAFLFQGHEMDTKTCFKCGIEKSIDEFYRHPKMKDGHAGKCKECNKIDVRENYALRREQYAAYEQVRYQRPGRRAAAAVYQRKTRAANIPAYHAKGKVNNAIRDGKLTRKPCKVCGLPNAQAHHEDYSKPFDVMWLCRKHHLERHGKVAYIF